MARAHIQVKSTAGLGTPTLTGIETAGSSWKRGAPLIYASGKLDIAGTNPRDIAGFALNAATGVTDAPTVFADAVSPGTYLEASLDSAGGLGTRALAQSDVGAVYGLTIDSDGIWYVDVDKSTPGSNTAVRVIGLVDPVGATTVDTPTDANSGAARVRCVLLTEATARQTAAA